MLQLVLSGVQDSNIPNRATREFMAQIPDRAQIGWNSEINYTLSRHADVMEKLHLRVCVGAAPAGFRWKKLWPLHFVKRLEFSIGGQMIWDTTTEALRMKYFIDGLRTYPDWATPTTNIELLRTPQECIFDYESAEERTRLSQTPHEVFFEPLSLKELISAQYPIPFVCLAYHDVRIRLQTAALEDCLEPIEDGAQLPYELNRDELLQTCEVVKEMLYLDTNERRALAIGQGGRPYEFQTKHHHICSKVFQKPAPNTPLHTYIEGNTVCTAAFVWITDENGNELPNQVLDSLTVKLNGQQRELLSGHMSRFAVRQQLSYRTLDNNQSQNLYYISYSPGRQTNGMEQGLNLSRIDQYHIDFRFNSFAPQRIKVNIVHCCQNELRIMSGMAGLRFACDRFRMTNTPPVREPQQMGDIVRRQPAHHLSSQPQTIEFTNTDQHINIPQDEKICLITLNEFKEGDSVQQCLGCHKIMSSDAVDTWIQQNPHNEKCAHCRGPYTASTFRKGKAHLVSESEPEHETLVRNAHRVQQRGWVETFMSWCIREGNTRVHAE